MIKKSKNKNDFDVYELTNEECKQLLLKASEAMKYTYPKSGNGYSVSLMTVKGKIYTGASYHSDTENLTMHSEAVALACAAQAGEIKVVAITGPNCHCCKQLIWESSIRSKIDTVIVFEEMGNILQVPISQMMLYPWPDHKGNK
jgi:cytidine deaminase